MTLKFTCGIPPFAIALVLAGPLAVDAAEKDGETASQGTVLKISKKDCRRLIVRHRPATGAAYQPNAPVRGRKFLPADLGGGFQMPIPDVIEFNVTRDLSYYLGKPEKDAAAAQAAATAAEQAGTAADSAETAASAAETLAIQSDALVAIEDATSAVAALTTERDSALATATANPLSSSDQSAYEAAEAALTTATTALTSAETSYAAGSYSAASTSASSAVSTVTEAGIDVSSSSATSTTAVTLATVAAATGEDSGR